MPNYIKKQKSTYRMICKYKPITNICLNDIFIKLKTDNFLICCKFKSSIKTYENNKFTEKDKTMINRFEEIPKSFYNFLEALVLYNNKFYAIKIFNNIIQTIVPNIKIGNNIANEIINKLSTDTKTNIEIEYIKNHIMTMNFGMTHNFDNSIFAKIINKFENSDDNLVRIKEYTPRMIGVKTELGILYIFINGKILFGSSKIKTEDEIVNYVTIYYQEFMNAMVIAINVSLMIMKNIFQQLYIFDY